MRHIVIFRHPDVKLIFGKVRNVARQGGRVVMHRLAHQNPSHVRPPFAIDRRMRIAFLIRKLVMNAVRRYPENRPAFERQRGANRQEIFHPLRSFVAAVREQPVIAHPDAQAPETHHRNIATNRAFQVKKKRLPPRPRETRHEHRRDPIDFAFTRLCSFQILAVPL